MSSGNLPIVVFDTNVLIGMLTKDPQYWPHASKFEAQAQMGEVIIAASEITIAEACKLTSEDGTYQHQLVERYWGNEFTRRFPVTGPVSDRAAALIRLFSLETCDSIIVATALARKARWLLTRDGQTIIKRIRDKQNSPASALAGARLPKKDFEYGDTEKLVLEELAHLEIVTIPKPPPPTLAPPVKPEASIPTILVSATKDEPRE